MKKLISLMALGLALTLGAAHAADPAAEGHRDAQAKQQSKMTALQRRSQGQEGRRAQGVHEECLSAKHGHDKRSKPR